MFKFAGKKVKILSQGLKGNYRCYNKELGDWFYLSPEMLEPIPKAKEYRLIVTDSKVIIIDKESKKKGVSTCHKEDTFDIQVGFELAWNRLNGIEEKLKLTPPEFNKGIIVDEGKTLPLWESEALKYGIEDYVNGGNNLNKDEIYDVLGYTYNCFNKKVYVLRGKNGSIAVEAEGIKAYEPKLYDCNGVELKDGDKVKNICLNSGNVYYSYVKRSSDGILYNIGLNTAHRADKNDGKYDRSKTEYSWFIVKI